METYNVFVGRIGNILDGLVTSKPKWPIVKILG